MIYEVIINNISYIGEELAKRQRKKENEQLVIEKVDINQSTNSSVQENSTEQKEVVEAVIDGQLCLFENEQNDAIIDKEIAKEKLSEAIETQKPKKKKKSIISNLIFLAINVFVLVFIIRTFMSESDGVPLKDIITNQGNRLWWLLGGVGLILIWYLADSMMFYFLIKSSTKQKRFLTSYKVSATGKYFESITPFAVGGQPAQILSLTKSGFSTGISTSIPIIKVIIYNIIYTITILSFFIFGVPLLPTFHAFPELFKILIKLFAYLGLAVTAIMSIMFILIGSGKIVGRSMVRGIVKLGYKLRIVKDYRKTYNKILNQVLEYQSSIQYLRKNKGTLVACICFGLLAVVAYFSVPFMIVMALSNISITSLSTFMYVWVVCISMSALCQMASVVIPLPGGTGMMELSFIALFGSGFAKSYFGITGLISASNIVWGLLAWRFLTYYFTIIQGFTISSVESVVRMIKARKNNAKEKIEQEQQK